MSSAPPIMIQNSPPLASAMHSHPVAMDNSEAQRPKPVLLSAHDPGPDAVPKAHSSLDPPSPHVPSVPALGAISGQKSLSRAQAAGIKAVEHILLENNGGLSSGTPFPASIPRPSPLSINAQIGPSSNLRPITRSHTAPAIASSVTVDDGVGADPVDPPPSPAESHVNPATKTSASDHFKMRPVPNTSANGKTLAQIAVANVAILADALRIIETRVDGTALDVANLKTEIRLRPRSSSPTSPAADVTWTSLYGVQLSASRSVSPRDRSRSRSNSSEGPDSELVGRVEEIEFQAEMSRNDLNARLLALEQRDSTPPTIAGLTASDVQKATVQRFAAVVTDLNLLNDGLYEQGKNYDTTNAELRSRVAALETANKSLHIVGNSLVLRTDSVQGRPPATTRRRSPSPVPRYRQNQQLSRPRSHSPQRDHIAKRLRLDEPNAFIAFGPLADSAETPQKLFELHLCTAIPQFRLEAPYAVELDPGFAAHVRVTVKSVPVARALMDAWATQKVAGYAKIKMVAMASASGQEPARNGIARPQLIHRGDANPGNPPHHSRPSTSNHARSSEPGRR
ncbi:hypothetical protein B0H10DRAFT_2240672 [Mycena sp. CBHHK59/15]|nr:hypothetical protein B0H10DRAFT_2240672 [Mycena sp. CBHHK59/15]